MSEVLQEPDRWYLLSAVDTSKEPIGRYDTMRASNFVDRFPAGGAATLQTAPSGMIVLVLEIPKEER